MFNQTTKLSSNHGYQPHVFGQSKAKTLSGAQESQVQTQGAMTLDQWKGLAKVWFDKANGKIPLEEGETMPTQAEYAQMTEYWNWATGQSNTDWDPNSASEPQVEDGDAVGGTDPFGGIPGTMRNIVFNAEKTRIDFTGNSQINDIWSDDVTIDVAPLSASVTSEITKDTRFNPAEEVLKVTVKDPATGTESVFMVHDYKDAKIKVNTPKETQLKSKAPSVTWGHFQEGSAAANVETEAVGTQNELGEWEYEAADTNEFLEFQPQGGDNQTNVVLGNTRIITKLSDHVNVTKNADGTFTVIVTHKDKTTDTYKIQKGFQLDLRANENYVSFGTGAEGTQMPDELSEDVTLNQPQKEETVDGEKDEDSGEGTKPTRVKNGVATYDRDANVELFTGFDDKISTHEIWASGKVTLHGQSQRDTFNVEYSPSSKIGEKGTFTITVSGVDAKGATRVETYSIDAGMVDKIVINADPSRITGGAADNEKIVKGSQENEDGQEAAVAIKAGAISNNIPTEGHTTDAAGLLASLFEEALLIKDPIKAQEKWDYIDKIMRKMGVNGSLDSMISRFDGVTFGEIAGRMNNAVRKLVTALFKAAGSDEKTFQELLKKIPVEVREAMKNWATSHASEMAEKQSGDEWNSGATAAVIQESL